MTSTSTWVKWLEIVCLGAVAFCVLVLLNELFL